MVDPFAGGSVRHRGRRAGRHYWGCDLRPEQIEANEANMWLDEIPTERRSVCAGDSMETLADAPGG